MKKGWIRSEQKKNQTNQKTQSKTVFPNRGGRFYIFNLTFSSQNPFFIFRSDKNSRFTTREIALSENVTQTLFGHSNNVILCNEYETNTFFDLIIFYYKKQNRLKP